MKLASLARRLDRVAGRDDVDLDRELSRIRNALCEFAETNPDARKVIAQRVRDIAAAVVPQPADELEPLDGCGSWAAFVRTEKLRPRQT